MKKLSKVLLAFLAVVTLVGCNKNKGEEGGKGKEKGNEVEEVKILTLDEVKDATKKAGYIVNDYIACATNLTEDQMGGFTVEFYTSATETKAYCVIVAVNEDYAKQACESVSNGLNTCVRSANVVAFPEANASADVQSMLKSITSGKPISPISYDK